MTIETKYNIGDEVWVMCHNRPIHAQIYNIFTLTTWVNKVDEGMVVSDEITILYELIPFEPYRDDLWDILHEEESYSEDVVFPTKEELLKSL